MTDEQGKKSRKIPVPMVLGVITVVFAAVVFAWAGSGSGSSKKQSVMTSRATVQTVPSSEDKAAVVTQMNAIQAGLVSAWQSCQANPSCVAQVNAIPDYQKLYDDKSTWFTGSASDDFASWRIDTGMAEGDMKQWAMNQIYGRPNPLTATVPAEIQNAADDSKRLAAALQGR